MYDLLFHDFVYKFTISKFTSNYLQKETIQCTKTKRKAKRFMLKVTVFLVTTVVGMKHLR